MRFSSSFGLNQAFIERWGRRMCLDWRRKSGGCCRKVRWWLDRIGFTLALHAWQVAASGGSSTTWKGRKGRAVGFSIVTRSCLWVLMLGQDDVHCEQRLSSSGRWSESNGHTIWKKGGGVTWWGNMQRKGRCRGCAGLPCAGGDRPGVFRLWPKQVVTGSKLVVGSLALCMERNREGKMVGKKAWKGREKVKTKFFFLFSFV